MNLNISRHFLTFEIVSFMQSIKLFQFVQMFDNEIENLSVNLGIGIINHHQLKQSILCMTFSFCIKVVKEIYSSMSTDCCIYGVTQTIVSINAHTSRAKPQLSSKKNQ